MLRNTPGNLIHWLHYPQHAAPGNAMPSFHLSDQDARDIAAYLYTLHGTLFRTLLTSTI
jgi:cytochrome c1